MAQTPRSDYLLGINQTELDRLRFQHTVWKPVTDRFFDRLGVSAGWRCLDVGAGPGFVAMDLRDRVGEEGTITVLEPSQFYLDWFRSEVSARGWKNVAFVHESVDQADLPREQFDLLYIRWVMSFISDPEQFLLPLVAALKPGGIIAVQDYYYEGLSLFPRGGAFEMMPDVVREYYKRNGGDAYVAGSLPALFRKHGLSVIDFTPVCLAGGPESGVMEWAHRFFTVHTQAMVDKGIVSQADGDAMVADWMAHRQNPDSLFFSPIVVDVAARRGHQN
jgi:ubiquinone/menaquinone biosynthesis C-methylase UbiE